MDCEHCAAREEFVLYEDDLVRAILSSRPAGLGHIQVIPRAHHTIIEDVPDDVVERLFQVANQVSLLLFNTLQVQGTNILVKNGLAAGQQVAHIALQVLARVPDDDVDFTWQPREIPEDKMSEVERSLIANLGGASRHPSLGPSPTQQAETLSDDDEDNYLLRHLDRRP